MSYKPEGVLKVADASLALAAGLKAIEGGQHIIDFSGVTAIDSSAVAVLIAWQRAAQARSTTLSFINIPKSLQSLSALYDVDTLLPSETKT
jgi:phospholipid transport system transporter-binding protein